MPGFRRSQASEEVSTSHSPDSRSHSPFAGSRKEEGMPHFPPSRGVPHRNERERGCAGRSPFIASHFPWGMARFRSFRRRSPLFWTAEDGECFVRRGNGSFKGGRISFLRAFMHSPQATSWRRGEWEARNGECPVPRGFNPFPLGNVRSWPTTAREAGYPPG